MDIYRRSFIKSFGVTLASLIATGSLSGCNLNNEKKALTAKEKAKPPSTKKIIHSDLELESLRQCWLNLNTLEQAITKAGNKNGADWFETAENVKKERAAKHRAILDSIVGADKLNKPVADQIQVAFEEAQFHIARSMVSCYMGLPNEYYVRSDLLKQIEVLDEISDGLDPKTFSQAQAAIVQDMAYFEIIINANDNDSSLLKDHKAGKLKASPEALEAARFLTELFWPEISD